MITRHCRHRAYHTPGEEHPTHCKAGVEYASLPYGRPKLGEGDPCNQRGHKAGRVCPRFEPRTAEEIVANRAEWERIVAAMLAGRCPECGRKLEVSEGERSTIRWCPVCPNVGIRECRHIGEYADKERP